MRTKKDLEKIGNRLIRKYKPESISFEILEKPYPESIIPGARIVDSMWLFVYWNDWKFTSGRLDSQCSDKAFKYAIDDLEKNLDETILGINDNDEIFLPF